jgi:hypothetical protein
MSTNLSRTTAFTRKFGLVFIIFAIVITILQITTGILTGGKSPLPSVRPSETATKDGCPIPNQAFKALPTQGLQSLNLAAGTKATFSTDSKKFPAFPSSLYVYKLNKIYEKLDDADRARATAINLGFDINNEVIKDAMMRWQNSNGTKILTFDKANRIWSLTTQLDRIDLPKLTQPETVYERSSRDLLSQIQLSNTNYSNPSIEYQLIIRLFNKTLESTTVMSKANILKINYLKSLPLIVCKPNNSSPVTYTSMIYSPDYLDQSFSIQLINTTTNFKTDLINLQIREFDIATDVVGTYPSITMEEAYLQLQTNKGILYWILPEGGNAYAKYKELKITDFAISVNSTKIVYLEPQKLIEDNAATYYIQPYYQFTGKATTDSGQKADFIFLVPAINPSSYK